MDGTLATCPSSEMNLITNGHGLGVNRSPVDRRYVVLHSMAVLYSSVSIIDLGDNFFLDSTTMGVSEGSQKASPSPIVVCYCSVHPMDNFEYAVFFRDVPSLPSAPVMRVKCFNKPSQSEQLVSFAYSAQEPDAAGCCSPKKRPLFCILVLVGSLRFFVFCAATALHRPHYAAQSCSNTTPDADVQGLANAVGKLRLDIEP